MMVKKAIFIIKTNTNNISNKMNHIPTYEEFLNEGKMPKKAGKYTLYNFFDDGPLPIEIEKISGNTIDFFCLYSYGNKHEWEEKFIGTEMEGLVYDPNSSDFDTTDIEKIDGDKIYLKK
jgi:hypothetical protein